MPGHAMVDEDRVERLGPAALDGLLAGIGVMTASKPASRSAFVRNTRIDGSSSRTRMRPRRASLGRFRSAARVRRRAPRGPPYARPGRRRARRPTGNSTMNVAPPSRRGSNRSVPPCAATIPNDTDSPRPVPCPGCLVVKNGRNSRDRRSSGMPGAVVAHRRAGSALPPGPDAARRDPDMALVARPPGSPGAR